MQRGRRANLNYLQEVKDPLKSIRSKNVKARIIEALSPTNEEKPILEEVVTAEQNNDIPPNEVNEVSEKA